MTLREKIVAPHLALIPYVLQHPSGKKWPAGYHASGRFSAGRPIISFMAWHLIVNNLIGGRRNMEHNKTQEGIMKKNLSNAAAVLGSKGGSSGKKGGRPQEYYTITCQKMGHTPETQHDTEIYEVFKVRATSHTQRWPYSTFLNGLSPVALAKINGFRAQGCEVSTTVGGRSVGIENK